MFPCDLCLVLLELVTYFPALQLKQVSSLNWTYFFFHNLLVSPSGRVSHKIPFINVAIIVHYDKFFFFLRKNIHLLASLTKADKALQDVGKKCALVVKWLTSQCTANVYYRR